MLILICAAGPCEHFAIYRHFHTSFLPLYMKVDIYRQTPDSHTVKHFGFPCSITVMPREKKVKTVKNAKGSV
jgi:hypothetical protein